MSDREMRLECLKAAASTAPTFEVLDTAKKFWEFVTSPRESSGAGKPDVEPSRSQGT